MLRQSMIDLLFTTAIVVLAVLLVYLARVIDFSTQGFLQNVYLITGFTSKQQFQKLLT